jgi:hypothetical protein
MCLLLSRGFSEVAPTVSIERAKARPHTRNNLSNTYTLRKPYNVRCVLLASVFCSAFSSLIALVADYWSKNENVLFGTPDEAAERNPSAVSDNVSTSGFCLAMSMMEGKPFKMELANQDATYKWAMQQDVGPLIQVRRANVDRRFGPPKSKASLHVSDAVVRRLVMQKVLPARQIVRFAPWMIERAHLDLPAVHRAIRLVHTGRREPSRIPNHAQTRVFCNPEEQLGGI